MEGWGKTTVELLAKYIAENEPGSSGFSARNIWRMKKFYDTYLGDIKLSTLLTEITWSNHLHILSKTKTYDETVYYLELASKNQYSARHLARIIDSGSYERTLIANEKLSTVLTEFPTDATGVFKDSYIFEFLNINEGHKEDDLRTALVSHLKQFLLELGPDFSFIGQEGSNQGVKYTFNMCQMYT